LGVEGAPHGLTVHHDRDQVVGVRGQAHVPRRRVRRLGWPARR
jgi:hypothetical protein